MKKVWWLIVVGTICILLLVGGIYGKYHQNQMEHKKQLELQIKGTIETIQKHYDKVVEVVADTPYYKKENHQFIKMGMIGKGEYLSLKEIVIDAIEDEYFPIDNSDYYVYHMDVMPSKLPQEDHSYDLYLPFNESVVTKDITNFYHMDNTLAYTVSNSFTLPIIVKEEDGYIVKQGKRYLKLKKEEIQKVIKSENTTESELTHFGVLTYHFFYDKGETCNQIICTSKTAFEEQLKYLKQNGYHTLSMIDVDRFLDHKVRLPQKSVVLTIDDGGQGVLETAIPLLNQYQQHATIFAITSWGDPNRFVSEYTEVASHSHHLHVNHVCPGGEQGGKLLCVEEQEGLADLIQSRQLTNDSIAFCYPFYEYNDHGISLVKKAGYRLAFTGGDQVTKDTDKFKIPRYTILSDTDMDLFRYMIR